MSARRNVAGRAAALVYTGVSLLVVAFQVVLAAGAPWGEYAMGGASPGQLSPALRVGALGQAAFLAGTAAVVVATAGLAWPGFLRTARWLIWVVVLVLLLSFVLNLITPSARERALWAPVAFLLTLTSGVVAVTGLSDQRGRDSETRVAQQPH